MHPKCAGLIYGNEAHHIDHLAVICKILHIPLLVTDEAVASASQKYYPGLEVILLNPIEMPEYLVSHYEVIFYSTPRDLFDEIFFFPQKLHQKKIHTVWCPHGNSDKGRDTFFMEALRKEETALVYGPQMIDFLKQKKVFDQLKAYVVTGNFRFQFYLAHKEFYDRLAQGELLHKLPQADQTILYAPTWRDYEKSSSFDKATPDLIEHLPSNWNLIIKLHPNLLIQDPLALDKLYETYADHPNVLFVPDFPPVYPLLGAADIYIGDASSIGYDFLAFDKPMFFLGSNSRHLTQAGVCVPEDQYSKIYTVIDHFLQFETRDFSKIRQKLYDETFGPVKNFDTLRHEIQGMLDTFPNRDINFF